MGKWARNKRKIYALYRNDEYIGEGTSDELAEMIHVKDRKTIIFYMSPTYKKRPQKHRYYVVDVTEEAREV